MTRLVLSIFRYLQTRRWLRRTTLAAATLLLVALVVQLRFKEDISDFLPLDSQHQTALSVYQDVAGAGNIVAIVQHRDTTVNDPDVLVSAIDDFTGRISETDTAQLAGSVTSRIDWEQFADVADFVYTNIPYFLSAQDYARMDSLLAQPGFVREQMAEDKQMLLFPSGGLLSDNISRDPLNLFTPVISRLQPAGSGGMRYETYDGCIFSPDMQRAIVIVQSPFGSSETEQNARLLSLLTACADSTEATVAGVDIHLTGGPAIAVGNARQIKADSVLSVALAAVLILALLLFSFRNVRNLLLIALSIAWGWLFAMGGLALVHHDVSIIVIGISSVIVGIAVNYPLHFIAHLSHTPDRAKALREIVAPLVVGNVTTVGAFLALVPLQSVALRDLGLFASFLLVGTIVFVLLYLPHLSVVRQQAKPTFLDRLGEVSLDKNRWVVGAVLVLTVVLGYFSFRTTFDANMSHINYMTPEQREDMEYFSRTMLPDAGNATVYALSTDSTADGALERSRRLQSELHAMQGEGIVSKHQGCSDFLASQAEQERRLALWKAFVSRHRTAIEAALTAEGSREGFAEGSFDGFIDILQADYAPQPLAFFDPLRQSVFASSISADSAKGTCTVVDIITPAVGQTDSVKARISAAGAYSFDVQSMNSAIAGHLSDDFNYIGWACSLIVFFFLWLSFGSLELALLSFVPMAISWVWILGIMGALGIEFNIVNIILATFIFGQGDDYTIFMTEGASYEYAYRRRMLASYKHSIIISALIMFIGIGTLIVARHPALHSLAEVTITGMFSVVLMAYIFPPLIFRWLVQRKDGAYRVRPLSFSLLFERLRKRKKEVSEKSMSAHDCHALVRDRYRYKGEGAFAAVCRRLRRYDDYAEWVDGELPLAAENASIAVVDDGWGELGLLRALTHKDERVVIVLPDDDRATFVRHCAEGIAENIETTTMDAFTPDDGTLILLQTTDEIAKNRFSAYRNIIIDNHTHANERTYQTTPE